MDDLPRMKLVTAIGNYGPMTAKQVLAMDIGFSRTSLYRMLGELEEAGVLEVVSETKVRAMTEKTYGLCEEIRRLGSDHHRDVKMFNSAFRCFALNMVGEFEAYARREGADPSKDGTGFEAIPVFGTAEECEEALAKIREVLEPMRQRTSEDQEMRTLALVLAPPFRGSPE